LILLRAVLRFQFLPDGSVNGNEDKAHERTTKPVRIECVSAMRPMNGAAIAPTTMDMTISDEPNLVWSPRPRMPSAKIVGYITDMKKRTSRTWHTGRACRRSCTRASAPLCLRQMRMTLALQQPHIGVAAEADIKVAIGRSLFGEADMPGMKPVVTARRNNLFAARRGRHRRRLGKTF